MLQVSWFLGYSTDWPGEDVEYVVKIYKQVKVCVGFSLQVNFIVGGLLTSFVAYPHPPLLILKLSVSKSVALLLSRVHNLSVNLRSFRGRDCPEVQPETHIQKLLAVIVFSEWVC